MKEEWLKYLSAPAPRYTSYPSALRFGEEVDAQLYEEKLRGVGQYEPVSIYVHIPYCKQLCWYCGCNMRVENRPERMRAYVDSLLREINAVGERLAGNGRVASVHFGGGTPNMLPAGELGCILDAIEDRFGLTDDACLAIELDPRLVRPGDIRLLADLGFSRMSLGVQDFDVRVQWAINRLQRFEIVEASIAEMREAGVEDVSFDLLYGLPKQTRDSFSETLDMALSLSPDRFAVFGYAHLPAALPRQQMIKQEDLPDPQSRAALAEMACDRFVAAGYAAIGFDHYARPDNALAIAMREGRLRRNFQGFTDDIAETTIGFGASAVSYAGGVYVQNHKDIKSYRHKVDAGALPVARGVVRSGRDQQYAATISRLLCALEADLAPLARFMSPDERAQIDGSLDRLERDGVIRRHDQVIEISSEARSLSRVVAAAIDPYFNAAQKGAPTV